MHRPRRTPQAAIRAPAALAILRFLTAQPWCPGKFASLHVHQLLCQRKVPHTRWLRATEMRSLL